MKKALFVATVGRFFEFEKNDIVILQSMEYEVHCAANFSLSPADNFQIERVIQHQIDFVRTPWSKANLKAYRELEMLLSEVHFDLVHCHTPVGGILARIVSRKYRKKGLKVIYTAHGFHFFKGAPLINWLLYFPAEWICAHWTDVLITINEEDYDRAKWCMRANKVVYVPGVGVDIEKFSPKNFNENEREKRRLSLGISLDEKMFLSVGELNENKNHATVIKALAKINNQKIHYFIAGDGSLKTNLLSLAEELRLEKNVHLLGFRNDVADLYLCADVYLLPSKREGLNVSLMEAIASKALVICSACRGNTDLVKDKRCLFDFRSSDELVQRINNISNLSKKETEAIIEDNYSRLQSREKAKIGARMKRIYGEISK